MVVAGGGSGGMEPWVGGWMDSRSTDRFDRPTTHTHTQQQQQKKRKKETHLSYLSTMKRRIVSDSGRVSPEAWSTRTGTLACGLCSPRVSGFLILLLLLLGLFRWVCIGVGGMVVALPLGLKAGCATLR